MICLSEEGRHIRVAGEGRRVRHCLLSSVFSGRTRLLETFDPLLLGFVIFFIFFAVSKIFQHAGLHGAAQFSTRVACHLRGSKKKRPHSAGSDPRLFRGTVCGAAVIDREQTLGISRFFAVWDGMPTLFAKYLPFGYGRVSGFVFFLVGRRLARVCATDM